MEQQYTAPTNPLPTHYRVSWTQDSRNGSPVRKTKVVTGEKAFNKLMDQIEARDGYSVYVDTSA